VLTCDSIESFLDCPMVVASSFSCGLLQTQTSSSGSSALQDEKLPVSCDRKAQSNLQRLRLDAAADAKHAGKQFLVRVGPRAS
jgi:hypothetical protein